MQHPDAPLRLTGTLVAQFFRFRCERQLRYDLLPEAARGGEVPRRNDDPAQGPLVGPRPGAELLLRAGRRWERKKLRELIGRFGGERVRVHGWTEGGEARRLPYAEVVRTLRDPGPVEFLVQPELLLPDPEGFAGRWGVDPARVRIAAAHPDLVRIRRRPGGLRFEVVDIKASREASAAHFAQVAFYTVLLEEICRAEGLSGAPELRRGWVWSRGGRGPRAFPLGAYRFHVEEFLRGDLPRVAALPPSEAAWHLSPHCGGCTFLHHCRAEAEAADDLARVPGITPLAKEVLHAKGIRTVRALTKSFRRDTYTGCHALEAEAVRLKQRAQALAFGKVFDVEAETHLMGAGEGRRVLLSAEEDPVTRRCFALGVRVEGGAGGAEVFVAERGGGAGERALLHAFLRRLDGVLSGGGGGIHFFVYDRGELALLRDVLERHVGDPEAQPAISRALSVLFPVDEAAGMRTLRASPGTVLADAVSALFALPVPYAYDLPSVSAVLLPAERPAPFAPPPEYARPFSGQVAFERVHELWRGSAEAGEGIRAAVEAKLAALDSVVRAVRERAERRGRSRLRMDALPAVADGGEGPIPHPLLEALRVFTRMESAAEALQLRALHTLPATDRARRFECIRGMEFVERRAEDGALVFEFDAECRDAKFRPGDFNLLLTNEGTDTLLETDRSPWKRRPLLVELLEYDLAADPPRVLLAPGSGFEKAEREGWIHLDRVCTLDRAPADFNTRRIIATLRALAAGAGAGEAEHVIGLLEGRPPEGWQPWAEVEAVREEVLEAASRAYGRPALNPDQERAWRAVLRRPVSLVWGPPGTGKTYLLAWALVGLAAAARRAGRPLRVLVSSATHRAIVNVLVRVSRELEATGLSIPFRAVKLRGSGSEADEELEGTCVEVVPDTRLPGLLAEAEEGGDPLVVGSTVWSLWKQMRAAGEDDVPVRPCFDVVVVDEASQVKVSEALIALSALRAGGQVILCGDDRQLAPIIRGRYATGGDTLFGSVFSHFASFPEHFPRLTLRESRRMNRALVEYPRELFYPGLVSMCPEHTVGCVPGTEHLRDGVDAMLWDTCFRPEEPVAFCTYRDFRAGARNPFEAHLVARLVRLARAGLLDPETGAPYTPERFVSHGVAVLSPHRAQNSAILGELLAMGWARDELPVVDTVERMQGNEREMVIVSYAVADGEYAEREAEFLLNPNRFNVSITRPKGKLVVLMSEAVLRVLPRDEEVMTGSMAVKGYGRHCRDGEREVELPAPDGTSVALRCRYRRLDG